MIATEAIEQAAARLFRARRDAEPIAPSMLTSLDVHQSYLLQDRLAELTIQDGSKIVGWKVGLTSLPAMAAFGASEPIAGRLFADTLCPPGSVIDFARTCDARVEGEILLEIGDMPDPSFDDAQLLASIASVRAAIEIADCRIAGWADSAPAAIADDACCGWVIVGEPHDASSLDLAAIPMRMTADGTTVAEGTGANCLGNPLNVYRWFIGKAAELGWRIEPGQFLLTGAIAPPVPAAANGHYEASLSGLGAVNFSFRETVVA